MSPICFVNKVVCFVSQVRTDPISLHGGVGRGCGVGRDLGVALGAGVLDGVGVGVGVAVGLGVGVGVGVGVGTSSQVSLKNPLLSWPPKRITRCKATS
jgi:hypothetical protein